MYRPRTRLESERVVYCGIERCFFEVSIRSGVFRYAMSKRVVTTDSSKDAPPCPPNLGAIMDKARRGSFAEPVPRATHSATASVLRTDGPAECRTSGTPTTTAAPAQLPAVAPAEAEAVGAAGVTPAPMGRVKAGGKPIAGPVHADLTQTSSVVASTSAQSSAAAEPHSQPALSLAKLVGSAEQSTASARTAAPLARSGAAAQDDAAASSDDFSEVPTAGFRSSAPGRLMPAGLLSQALAAKSTLPSTLSEVRCLPGVKRSTEQQLISCRHMRTQCALRALHKAKVRHYLPDSALRADSGRGWRSNHEHSQPGWRLAGSLS